MGGRGKGESSGDEFARSREPSGVGWLGLTQSHHPRPLPQFLPVAYLSARGDAECKPTWSRDDTTNAPSAVRTNKISQPEYIPWWPCSHWRHSERRVASCPSRPRAQRSSAWCGPSMVRGSVSVGGSGTGRRPQGSIGSLEPISRLSRASHPPFLAQHPVSSHKQVGRLC